KHSSRPPSSSPSTRPPAPNPASSPPYRAPPAPRTGASRSNAPRAPSRPPRKGVRSKLNMSWASLLAISVAGALGLGVIIGLIFSTRQPSDGEFLLYVDGLPPNKTATVAVDGQPVTLPFKAPRGKPITVSVEAPDCKPWKQPNVVASSGEVHLFYPSDRCP
ncbi:MAG TPA: hypothetical protein VFS00_12980, partial [Polyangiaceae bacterium]|nr:hypothetical protein [Polyangiaceae bacterium]